MWILTAFIFFVFFFLLFRIIPREGNLGQKKKQNGPKKTKRLRIVNSRHFIVFTFVSKFMLMRRKI